MRLSGFFYFNGLLVAYYYFFVVTGNVDTALSGNAADGTSQNVIIDNRFSICLCRFDVCRFADPEMT